MKEPIRQEKYLFSRSYVYLCEKCGKEVRRYNRIADRYTILCEECRKARYKQRLIDNDAKHDAEIRADERARVVKEIGSECSDKDLNENIDWCIQTLSLFHMTVLDKKRLCETLESQKAMIAMHDAEIRANERRKFAEWFKKSNYYLCYSDTIDEVLAEYEDDCKYLDEYERRQRNET